MAKTFAQMADEAISRANSVTADEALAILIRNPSTLLVDVRDESEVEAIGLGVSAINAPGRSLAWKADRECDEEYREPEIQDRSRCILTACGSSPCYRGAKAANLLTRMGFTDVAYVEGGMEALLEAGIATK